VSPDTEAVDAYGTETDRARPGRLWTYLIAGAAAVFVGALILVAMRLVVDVREVNDTPEQSVDAFLTALLTDRDAPAASQWLCSAKADSDFDTALERLSMIDGPDRVEWSDVTETGRTVGEATVTAEVRMGGSGEPVTWSFTVVAEDGDPQWVVCDVRSGD
jgi:hypothetical protein